MNLIGVYKLIMFGGKYARKAWNSEATNHHIWFEAGMPMVTTHDWPEPYAPTPEDQTAQDWYEYKMDENVGKMLNKQEGPQEDLERHYKFKRRTGPNPEDVEEIEIPETELTIEQHTLLATSIMNYFNSMPGIAQEMFTSQLADIMQKERESAMNAAKASHGKITDVNGSILNIQPKGEA